MVFSNFGVVVQATQASNVLVWVAIISASSAIISASLVGYINYRLEKQRIEHVNQLEKQKVAYTEYQKQLQTYSQLMGRQHTRAQVYGAYFSALIDGNYYDLLSMIKAISNIDFDLIRTHGEENIDSEIDRAFTQERVNSKFYKEQQNERQTVAKLMLISGKTNERFWTTIGLIRILFSNMQNLDDMIEQIEKNLNNYSSLSIEFIDEYDSFTETIFAKAIDSNTERDDRVRKWTTDVNSQLRDERKRLMSTSAKFGSEMNDLLSNLKNELNNNKTTPPS